jgi:hypothetical protein
LDRKTGKVLGSSEGTHDRLLVSGDLLLAADSRHATEISEGRRWLVGRRTTNGTVVFRVGLLLDDLSPRPIREIGGLFLIQTDEAPGGKADAVLVDREGKVRHRFDYQVVDGIRHGDDYIFLTSHSICRHATKDKVVWTIPFPYREWPAGGGLFLVPNGDVIAFLFSKISDSGVQVVRVDPLTGGVIWQARCKELGVLHSEYSHRAQVKVNGDTLRVTSQGSAGTFVEILDLASGEQLERDHIPSGMDHWMFRWLFVLPLVVIGGSAWVWSRWRRRQLRHLDT